MCCGQKRAELRSSLTSPLKPNAPPTTSSYHPTQVRRPAASGHAAMQAPPPGAGSAQQSPGATSEADPGAAQLPSRHFAVSLRYLEKSPIRVRGPITGRFYEFSQSRRVQSVDARDANSLLLTRYFRRA